MVDMKEANNTSLETVKGIIISSIEVKQKIIVDEKLCELVAKVARIIATSLINGGKVLICGNGGSASDALHFCCEIVGRFQKERKAAPAISLNSDVATMTAIANDYGYDAVFEREVQAFMKPEDVLVGISTSGNSENVLRAIKTANEIGGTTVSLLGKNGGKIKDETNVSIVIPSDNTARIQESHICIIHAICELVENELEMA